MIKFNSTVLSKNETIFQEFYSFNVFHIFGLAVSLINVFAVTPLMSLIIWFQQFGTNHNRTLINQFVTSTCCCGMAFNLVGQIPEILIGIFGPFHETFCSFHIIIKNVIVAQFVVLLTGISVVKFIYIFVTKNPSGQNDDFICFFVNLSCGLNSLLYQFVLHFMPGNNSHPFYFCSAVLPGKNSVKFNFIHW